VSQKSARAMQEIGKRAMQETGKSDAGNVSIEVQPAPLVSCRPPFYLADLKCLSCVRVPCPRGSSRRAFRHQRVSRPQGRNG
jgi:hypothetical protein